MTTATLPQRDWIATEFAKGIDAEHNKTSGTRLNDQNRKEIMSRGAALSGSSMYMRDVAQLLANHGGQIIAPRVKDEPTPGIPGAFSVVPAAAGWLANRDNDTRPNPLTTAVFKKTDQDPDGVTPAGFKNI